MADPTTITPETANYYEGVLDIYYAVMTGADTAVAAPTYGEPAVLCKTVNVTLTPQYREGSRYASNRKVRNVRKIDAYEVSIAADQVIPSVRRKLLGRKSDSKGVDIIDGDTDAPYVAIGFALTKENGKKELWWLYKGKFAEIETNADTSGDSIEYRDVALTATFDRRVHDNALGAVLDEDADDADAATVAAWFSAVYEKTPVTPTP